MHHVNVINHLTHILTVINWYNLNQPYWIPDRSFVSKNMTVTGLSIENRFFDNLY